jgi:hypothetical protein
LTRAFSWLLLPCAWRTTADTSPSHARSGVFFAAFNRADNSASVTYGRPAAYASCLSRSASLNTTRAQPNARASAVRWLGEGYRRYF